MKLSEAIRKGAEIHPQGFGELVEEKEDDRGTYLCTCALGAAWVGLGNTAQDTSVVQETGVYEALLGVWPELGSAYLNPDGMYENLQAIICSLNDAHKWDRERIADWLGKDGL